MPHMNEKFEMFDVVALLKDLPDHGLVTGQVGTIVESLAENVFEVEFCDEDGRTYASVALKDSMLIHLHYFPVPA